MSHNSAIGGLLGCSVQAFQGAQTTIVVNGPCILHTIGIGYNAATGQVQIYDSITAPAGKLIFSHTTTGTFEPTSVGPLDALLTTGLSIVIGQAGITVVLTWTVP